MSATPLRPSLHNRRGESLPSSGGFLPSSTSSAHSKLNPFKFMTRNVSWDPAVTVIAEPRQTPRHGSSACSSDYDSKRMAFALHPLLAPETNTIFDARLAPATVLPSVAITEPASASCARHLRIISREFPWTLEVSNHKHVVTCADVFNALYAGLSVPLTPAEWTLADDTKKDSIMRANRTRRGGSVRRLRRIDWLGSRVYFKGLIKDDGLGRSRLLPEDDLWPDTWVVKFGSH